MEDTTIAAQPAKSADSSEDDPKTLKSTRPGLLGIVGTTLAIAAAGGAALLALRVRKVDVDLSTNPAGNPIFSSDDSNRVKVDDGHDDDLVICEDVPQQQKNSTSQVDSEETKGVLGSLIIFVGTLVSRLVIFTYLTCVG